MMKSLLCAAALAAALTPIVIESALAQAGQSVLTIGGLVPHVGASIDFTCPNGKKFSLTTGNKKGVCGSGYSVAECNDGKGNMSKIYCDRGCARPVPENARRNRSRHTDAAPYALQRSFAYFVASCSGVSGRGAHRHACGADHFRPGKRA
ncbi:hypothetical protein BH10PSE9_BH10PSE9_07460 [soil metagenome]